MTPKKWFTFIEVLIVIAVFSIGVLAVLRLVLHNMSVMDTISTRTTATFLSKEGIALVYNIRDTNRLAGLPWDCVVNTQYDGNTNDGVCSDYFLTWDTNKIWQIGFDPKDKIFVHGIKKSEYFTGVFASTSLYMFSGSQVPGVVWYSYDSRWIPTAFARYIVLTGVVEKGKILPIDRIAKIESHVLFMKGIKTWDVVLESFIWNY